MQIKTTGTVEPTKSDKWTRVVPDDKNVGPVMIRAAAISHIEDRRVAITIEVR